MTQEKLGAQFPGVAGAEELGEIAFAFFLLDVGDLLVDQIFVLRDVLDGAENADGGGESGHGVHAGDGEGVDRIFVVLVVDQ